MANAMNEILERVGLQYEDLTSAERETLKSWMQDLDSNQLTLDGVKNYVASLKSSVEQELQKYRETPQTWLGVISLFIPIYGLIRKWYQDQYKLGLESRLRNLMLLDAFLASPEKAKEALEKAIGSIATNRKV